MPYSDRWQLCWSPMLVLVVFVLFGFGAIDTCAAEVRPNILFITVDDMNCDSVGVYGCELKDTTPNMDKLASQGLRFKYAHVQVGNCYPSRNVMWSGLYPHTNRVEGFYKVQNDDYPVLADLMKQGGYYAGIRGKVTHSTPYHPYAWSADLTMIDGRKMDMKNAESYYVSTRRGIGDSKKAGKPFTLIINISDPHKPFYSGPKDRNPPSKVSTPPQVPVPGFLFDHPAVRKELALYYTSVRRADDCVGAVLKALDDSGQADNTVVMFLSDHGMPLPFAKTQLYHHSTRTPWIVRWPGVVKPNTVDDHHMISAIDALPTLLDITGIKHPKGLQGKSFLPLLKGEKQDGRDRVIKEYNENAGGGRHPMRGVETRKFLYLYNPWSNGVRKMRTATLGTATYRAMKELAANNKKLAARLHLFEHRVPEELYDVENDPDATKNLAGDPKFSDQLNRMRKALEDWMVRTDDHMLNTFRNRDDKAVVAAYMARVEAESAERRKNRRKKQPKKKNKKDKKDKKNKKKDAV